MRLNTAMKAQVVEKAMDHKFKKRLKDHETEHKAIGRAFWEHLYGAHAKAIGKVPRELLNHPRIHGSLGLGIANFTIGGQYHQYPVHPDLPVSIDRMTIAEPALVERHRSYLAENDAVKADMAKVQGTLTAMLKNIQTYARLESDWPEGKRFYSSLPVDFPYQHQVPAVQIKELNTLLGLVA